MTERIRIKPSSLPPRLPLVSTAVLWLLLDRFNAPMWLMGLVMLVCFLLCVAVVVVAMTSVFVDVPGFGERTRRKSDRWGVERADGFPRPAPRLDARRHSLDP